MFKEKPDGITYRQNMPYVEYYMDERNNKISLIIHMWDDYIMNGESNATAFTDIIICTTLYKDELIKAGTLTTTYQQNGNIVAKQLKDPNKKEVAYYKYEYQDGIPFPFIIEKRIDSDRIDFINSCSDLLNEYWLYKEKAVFDHNNQWISYEENIWNEENNENDSFQCLYNEKGQLIKMVQPLYGDDLERKELTKDLMFSSEVNLSYDNSGMLDTINYWRSSMNYGTWNSYGKKYYDEQKRLVYAFYYVTHGSHYQYYVYIDNMYEPWIRIDFCSMPYSGSIEDGTAYGHDVSFVLLQ